MIKDFKENEDIEVELMVANVTKGVTNKSVPYLNITFQDSTGTIEGRKWLVVDEDKDIFVKRKIVKVKANVIKYGGTFQLKVLSGEEVETSEDKMYSFAPSAPLDRKVMINQLVDYMSKITDTEVYQVVERIVSKNLAALQVYPAAIKNHHEYISGLLQHTVGMLKCAEGLIKIYPNINSSYLYAGAILHDIGKIEELSEALTPVYTPKGKLVGHISIIQATISEVCHELKVSEETSMVLQHLALSHHGQKEFGSPVLPMTREAEVLSMIDNLDARMNMIDKALREVPEGEFSIRVPGLDNRAFYQTKKDK